MAKSLFKRAEKRQVPLKLGISGPSGSGKTMSALLLAYGIYGPSARIAIIDTENESSALYSGHEFQLFGRPHRFEFDIAPMSPPFLTAKYNMAMDEIIQSQAYDVVIYDTFSAAWSGQGGILERKDAVDARGGNRFSNWGPFTKEYSAFMDKLLNSPIDCICTMRSKTEYAVEKNGNDKSAPKKLGLAPQTRDGVDYEFTVVFDLAIDNQFVASKDRTGMFKGVVDTITPETGRRIQEWRMAGKVVEKAQPQPRPAAPPQPQPKLAPAKSTPPPEPEPLPTTGGLSEPPDPPADDDIPENRLNAQHEDSAADYVNTAPTPEQAPPKPAQRQRQPAPARTAKNPEDLGKANDPANEETLTSVWEYGIAQKLSNERMQEIITERTGKDDWGLTNFEVKAVRNAFAQEGKR